MTEQTLNLVPLLTMPWKQEAMYPPATLTQHPTLPPFIEHTINAEVNAPANEDIIVGDYHIDGVVDIISVESRRHVIAFYEAR